jgi:tRNA threonylcarbamoyladenosine biosynthesis protein TsaE
MIISHSPADTFLFGKELATTLRGGEVLAIDGDLGAGKTQFVKGLAAGLGHTGEVTSPTFTLIHEYIGGRLPLFHFDFYRLETEKEVLNIGLDEYLDAGGVAAIEWAGKFPALLPKETKWLRFRAGAGDERVIET